MATLIKNNPIKLFFAGLLSIVLGLNYFGFCFQNTRFLSDEEKIDIAVKYLIQVQSQVNTVSFTGELIPYLDSEELISLNPKCCVVTTFYRSSIGECWGLLTGSYSSTVMIKYLERRRDKNGLIKAWQTRLDRGINNCGELIF